MAVPFASAASPGPTFSARAKSEEVPPPLIETATLPAISPQGCTAPNRPQPSASRRHVLMCAMTSAGTSASLSSETHAPSFGVTAVVEFACIRLLNDLFQQRERGERFLVDGNAEARPNGRTHVAVLHHKVGFRHQRIGADHAEPEDEFAGRHHVLGRAARIEMGTGCGF